MKEEGHEIEMGTPKWKIMAEFDRIGLQSALGPTPNGWNSYFRPYKDDVTIRDAIMNVLGLEDGRAQEVLDPIISEDGNVDWEGVASAFEMRLQEVDDDSGERHERDEGCKEQPEERKGNMPTSKQAELASDLLTSPETMPRIQTPTNIDVVLSEVGDEEPPRHDQPQSSRDRTFLEAGTETEVAEIDTKRDTSGDESFPSQKLPSQSRKGIIIPQSKLGFQTVRGDARISKEAGGIQLMSNSGFTTVRYNVGVFRGKWMYEVQLGSGGIMQLGFTSPKDRFNSEDGVGDTKDSYAYDGKRQKKWNIRPTSYGDKWTGGDIIGCGIDLDNRTVSFWRNGKPLGEAFKNLFGRESGIVYLPGISMSYGESCECNMGGRPFIYPQEGYEPFEERPSKAVCLRAEFVGKALLRFAGSIGVQNEALSRSPRSAAAMAATFAMTPINDSRMGSQPFISARANGNDQTQDYLNDSNNEILGSESNFETQSDYRNEEHLQHSGNLGFVQSAPELLSELAPALLGKACDLHSNNRIQLDATHDLQQDLVSIHKQPLVLKPETILLASIIARFIGPLCLNPYLVEQCILNPLLELCLHESFHESGDFDRLLIILINVLEPFESEYLSYLIIGALARTVRRSIWEPKDFPESPASRFVGYARRFLRVRPFRKAWLDYKLPGGCSCWQRQLEELLEVRQPTINELEEILPHLKWEGDMTDEASTQLVLSASTAKGDFSADYTALSAMHMHLEDAHAFLLRDLCDWSDENPFDVGGDDFFSHTSRSCPAKSQKCVSYSSSRKQQGNLMPWDASLKEVMRLSMAHVKDSLFTASGDEEISVQLSDHISNELGSCLAEINGADSNVIVPQPLGAFLFWLEAKNAGARRDVPPPGLSAPSVLPSVFYATLRVFRHDIFDSIYLRGNDFSIPHGFFFRGLESLEAKRQYSFSRYFNRKPPEPAARLGGSITHLIRENVANLKHCKGDIHIDAKESVPKEKFLDPQLSDSSLDWTGNDLDGPWKWWLIDRLMRLYSLGVAPRIRMGFTYGNTIDQALSSLQHMMARWREERNPGAVELLRLSIEESRKLALTAVRQQCWSVCWMMIPWKQEVSLAVASIVSRVLSIVATKNKLSLPFVPEYYLESVLDIMHSLRQSEARLWDNERLMYSYGFDSIISCIFILSAAEKNGIVSPDAKAMLAQTVGSLLQEENSLPLLAKNPIAMQYLLSAICVQCSDERNWLAVSNGLGEMFSTGGFGAPKDFQYVSLYESKDQNHEVANESNSNSENRDNQIGSGTGPVVGQDPTEESFRHDIGDGDTSAHPDRDSSAIRRRVRSTNPVSLGIENQASMTMQFKYNTSTEEKRDKSLRSSDYRLARYHVSKVLFDGLKHDFSLSDSFLNSIFDHINWTITEMLSIVDELPAGEENSENDLVHRHETSTVRRALATCELAGKLVRTLEAIAVNAPEVLIGDATVLLDGREKAADDADERVSNAALELKTTRLAEIISFGLQQFGPESKAVKWLNKCPVYLIAAYLGIILALKGEPETRTPLSYSRTRQRSLTEALIGQGLKPEIVEKAEKLVLATCEASKEEEESRNLENTGPTKLKFEYPPQYEMEALHSAVKMLWEHYRAVTNLAQNSSQINKAGIEGKGRRDGDIGEEDEAPPEFLDPIMSTVMRDPVLLPSSGIIVDRLTIERHLLSSGSDPFSRAPLTRDELRPDADLRRRITEWRNARIGQ